MTRGADPEQVLANRARVGILWDLYGALLTGRQREILGLYYGEDLSLAEVAERTGVSRQAVHDLLRRTLAGLEGYEARLRLAERTARRQRRGRALRRRLLALGPGLPAEGSGSLVSLLALLDGLVED